MGRHGPRGGWTTGRRVVTSVPSFISEWYGWVGYHSETEVYLNGDDEGVMSLHQKRDGEAAGAQKWLVDTRTPHPYGYVLKG